MQEGKQNNCRHVSGAGGERCSFTSFTLPTSPVPPVTSHLIFVHPCLLQALSCCSYSLWTKNHHFRCPLYFSYFGARVKYQLLPSFTIPTQVYSYFPLLIPLAGLSPQPPHLHVIFTNLPPCVANKSSPAGTNCRRSIEVTCLMIFLDIPL